MQPTAQRAFPAAPALVSRARAAPLPPLPPRSAAPRDSLPATLLDQPQPLGVLPTLWYWRRIQALPAAKVLLLLGGVVSGFTAATLVSRGVLGVAASPLIAATVIGLIERQIRAVLRRRRARLTTC